MDLIISGGLWSSQCMDLIKRDQIFNRHSVELFYDLLFPNLKKLSR